MSEDFVRLAEHKKTNASLMKEKEHLVEECEKANKRGIEFKRVTTILDHLKRSFYYLCDSEKSYSQIVSMKKVTSNPY